jgi:hypothetical protein
MVLLVPLAIGLLLLFDDPRWGMAAFILAAGFAGAFAMVLLLPRHPTDLPEEPALPEPPAPPQSQEGELPVHPTTGLYRWWFFRQRLKEEIARHDRQQHGFSVLLLEPANLLDEPTAEGYALAARTLRRTLRTSDLAAQFDDERFVVFLPETEGDEAKETGRRLLSTLRSTSEEQLRWRGALVTYPQDGADSDTLLERALILLRPGRLENALRGEQAEQPQSDGSQEPAA